MSKVLKQASRSHLGLRTQCSIFLPSCRTMTSLAPSFNARLASVRPAPAAVGDGVGSIQTPALILDKGALLANLRRLPALVRESSTSTTVRIRPHFKAHKCGAIAKLQLEEGEASGFCFQKVSEMEPLIRFFEEDSAIDAGKLLDLLVTNEVVERSKLRRLCELASHPSVKRVGVTVDDAGVLQMLMDEARAASGGAASRVGVVIEIDVGQQRCGIDIASQQGEEAFVALARQLIAAHRDPSGHVSFIGLQAYHGGNQHVRAAADRERTVQHVAALARKALDLLRANDCLPEGEFLVSGGGTGSFPYEVASGVYNEIQPGSYALMDRDYCLNKNAEDRTESPFKNSMFILSTVISTASAGRGWVTLDAGLKAYAVDSGLPVVWQNDELDCEQAGDEHTKLIPRTPGNLAALAHLKVGDRVWLVPGHCDPTSNLYDWMVAVQEDMVTDVWAVSARGPGM